MIPLWLQFVTLCGSAAFTGVAVALIPLQMVNSALEEHLRRVEPLFETEPWKARWKRDRRGETVRDLRTYRERSKNKAK